MLSKVVEEQSRALQLDALRSSHPVEVPIRHAKVPNWQGADPVTGFQLRGNVPKKGW